jgi:hypothetical protein
MNVRRLCVVAAALLTAGCGSTVQGLNATGNGAGGGLSAPSGAAGPAAAPGGGTGPGSTLGVPGNTSGGASVTGPGAPGATSSGSGPGSTVAIGSGNGNGPGICASTIYVGESWDPDVAAADSAVGGASGNPGDTKGETDAVIAYINHHGGIAHRQVAPVWHQISTKDDASTSAEATCQDWTQDHKVFVLAGGDFRGAGTLMDECARHEGGIELNGGDVTMETTAVEAQYPGDFDLIGLANDRAMSYTIAGLAKLGYFSRGAKVGLVTWDDPYFHYGIDHAATPALAALGLHNVPVSYIASPASYGDLTATSAAVSSAVLKYSSTVDHVIIFEGQSGIAGGGILTLEWMQQAHSQNYHPRYGLNSTSGFNALTSDLPQDELPNSVGVGWEPALEQTASDFDAMPKPAQSKLCKQIMDQAGQHVSGGNAIGIQYGICDYFFLLKETLDSMSGPINRQTAIAAFEATGTRHQSLVSFGAEINSQRRDLPYLVRNVTYQSGCSCFRYVGAVYNPDS